jgi:hypothetical protein
MNHLLPNLYTKKPVTIEAAYYDWTNVIELAAWLGKERAEIYDEHDAGLHIATLEGSMKLLPGSWLVRGVKGEFYPVRHDIFEATYEPAQS